METVKWQPSFKVTYIMIVHYCNASTWFWNNQGFVNIGWLFSWLFVYIYLMISLFVWLVCMKSLWKAYEQLMKSLWKVYETPMKSPQNAYEKPVKAYGLLIGWLFVCLYTCLLISLLVGWLVVHKLTCLLVVGWIISLLFIHLHRAELTAVHSSLLETELDSCKMLLEEEPDNKCKLTNTDNQTDTYNDWQNVGQRNNVQATR